MVPTRPEFFYHPALGVVSPTSLGLFAFKQGPLVVSPPLASSATPPKPLNRVTPPVVAEPTVMNTASSIAIAAEISPSIEPVKETDVKKVKSSPSDIEVCIVTGEEMPISEMIRFVVDPNNAIAVDLSEKLPGTGFWIKADKEIVKKAIWRNSFTTANRAAVTVPKDILETIQIGLLRQSMETLGLARKAGLLIQGFAKAEEVLKEGRAALYVVASDAKENGREKLEKLAIANGSIPVLETWTSSQLSAALGQDNAVHVVLTAGGLTEKLLIIAHKLKDMR